jgi:CDP-glucose 4,6-dehydratase
MEALVGSGGIDRAYWSGRRVLVTGHTGFKGGWLCLWLSRLGARVSGFSLAPEQTPNLHDLADVSSHVAERLGDLRDLPAVQQVLSATRPEVVFHLAAQSLVRRSYAEPVETFSTNVMGTAHLLEAVRSCPSVRAVVVVTSDKCYENRNLERGYVEADPMGGYDPYSASKGCAELVTAAWRRSFFTTPGAAAIASARAGNVIGGGDWATDRLLPDLLRAFSAGEPARIRNPEAVRPWQHVLEPLAGYLLLAQALLLDGERHARGWNFGPDADANATVRRVADLAVEAWGPDARWAGDAGPHPHEANLLLLDSTSARSDLRWSPRLSLHQAVTDTVRWHRRLVSGEQASALCIEQIMDYERLLSGVAA